MRRVALVIGNAAYSNLTPLPNPVNDARALKELLERHGFKVILKENLGLAQFDDALAELKEAAEGADEIVVFYAGHGLHADGNDLLAPVDFDYACPEASTSGRIVPRRGIALTRLTSDFGPPQARKLVLIDACRNAPLARCKGRGDGDGSSGLQFRDLGRVALSADKPLIVNSTERGARAIDGLPGQPHSPFVTSLVRIATAHPGLKLSTLLTLVGKDVDEMTNHVQSPQIVSTGGSGALEMCLRGHNCTWAPDASAK